MTDRNGTAALQVFAQAFTHRPYLERSRVADAWPGTSEPSPARSCRVERVAGAALDGYQRAWADLAARSLEANVFLEPGFALPLLRHARFVRPPDVLLAWDDAAPERLIGLLPVTLPRRWRSLSGTARGYHHEQVALGIPLLDHERGAAAFSAMLAWLRVHRAATALLLTAIPADGVFARALATLPGLAVERLDRHRRAILLPAAEASGPGRAPVAGGRRGKEMRRQRRRLSELGRRRYTSARSPAAVARATERFLALENAGWKGGRGTAMLADPRLARFARSMSALMARDGRCRIDAIEVDGRAVAMGIILTHGDRAHFWKTTFDERYASLSPGVQFAGDLTDALRAEPTIAAVDSCAVADHPMIDRLWPDRLAICDLLIAVDAARPARWRRAVWIERARRWVRRTAKTLVAKAMVPGTRRPWDGGR